jgi:hypothetical protein
MIAHQQQERLPTDKFTRAKHRVTITKRRVLLDKPQPATLAAGGSGIRLLISRTYHDTDLIDAGAKYFLDDDPQRCFGNAVSIHQRLQRKCPLRFASGGDDSFFDFHGFFLSRQRRRERYRMALHSQPGVVQPVNPWLIGPGF